MHKSASLLLSLAQMQWNAYCTTSFGGLEWLATKCTIQTYLTVAFIGTNALKCVLHHKLWGPRVVCLQLNAQICLTVAFIGTNAVKCLLHHKLWGPRVVCLQLNAQICLTVAFIGTKAVKCLLHHKLWGPRVVCFRCFLTCDGKLSHKKLADFLDISCYRLVYYRS